MITVIKAIVVALVLSCSMVQATLSIQIVQGSACAAHIEQLIKLRLETFIEFPYLYVGNEEFEKALVGAYPDAPDTLFALAYQDDKLAGIVTGTPLQALCKGNAIVKDVSEKYGLLNSDYYYLGEGIMLKEFRNKGIVSANSKVMEENVKKLGYKYICFITSEREENHPQKPKDYKGPTSLFQKLGCTKTDIRFTYPYPTLQQDGSVEIADNVLAVWIKEL